MPNSVKGHCGKKWIFINCKPVLKILLFAVRHSVESASNSNITVILNSYSKWPHVTNQAGEYVRFFGGIN
jgi:hypothetical protein